MSNNIAVKITADVVDLQSKFGTARAELQATEAEFRKLARASAQGILSDADKARYAQLSQTLLEQRSAVKGLSSDLAEAGFASSTFGRAAAIAGEDAAQLGINTAGAVRYTRELFDEFSSGRTRYVPSTLAELATAGFHLSPAMLAGAGGVAALVAGLGYLIYRANEASDALDHLHLSSLRAGNEFTRTQLDQLNAQLAQLPSVSSSSATEITTALSSIHLPFQALQAASRIAAEQMAQTGQTAKQVGAEIAKALTPATSATEVAKRYQNDLTQAQVDAAEAADKSGNANAILAEKLQLLSVPLARGRTEVKEYGRSWGQAFYEVGAEIGLAQEGMNGQKEVLKENTSEWDANAQAISQYTAELRSLPTQKALTFKTSKVGGGAGDNGALAAAEEAANLKQQISEQEIRQASHALDQIAAAQDQARARELAADEQAANEKQQISEREIQQADQTLNRMAAAAKREAKEELDARQVLARDIESAEGNLVQNIVAGRRTLGQSIMALGQELAAQEIQQDLQAMTTRLLLAKEGEAQKRALEQGGVLYHAVFENQKTGISLAGEVARTAATAAGEAQRWAIYEMAEARALALKIASALKRIGIDAMEAGAGAFKAMVSIPYVGPILAVAAAATAVMEVKKFASFDQGSFNLPQDMVAQVHAGEMIIPRPFAQEIRDKGTFGGAGSTYNLHVHAPDGDSVNRLFLENGHLIAQAMGRQLRNGWTP